MSAVINFAKSAYSQPGSGISALLGLGTLICLIVLFATLNPNYVTLGLSPFLFIMGAVTLMGIGVLISKIDIDLVSDASVTVGIIAAVTLVVVLFVSNFCMRIRPIELFADASAATTEANDEKKLKDAETEVCKLVTKANDYIKANVGFAGIDHPEKVTEAQQKAMLAASTGGSILSCPVPPDNEGLQPEERLNRMDRTLDRFVEPEIKKACIKAGVCMGAEGFADPPPQALDVDQRLKGILTRAKTIKAQYLDPMDAKTADLRKGIASDSDKKAGAESAMTLPVT